MGVQSKSLNAVYQLTKEDHQKLLHLSLEKHENVELGQYIPRAEAQNAPKVALPAGYEIKSDSKFILVSLDGDAPFRSFDVLGPILHWIQPNYQIDPSTSKQGEPIQLTLHEQHQGKHITDYIGPAPPPMSGPHRYSFMVFEQPADADFSDVLISKPFGMGGRIRYSLDDFEKKHKLGPWIAANYFESN